VLDRSDCQVESIRRWDRAIEESNGRIWRTYPLTLCQLESTRFEIFNSSRSFLIELICASPAY
jgi:hypothetical protein